jgi:hypothetical protein
MNRKNFRVWATVTSYCYLDVKAENVDDAMSIVEDTDGGDFTPCPDDDSGSFEIYQAEERK